MVNESQSKAATPVSGRRLIISVKEARKILGKQSHAMSDDQIEEMIIVLSDMSERFLQNAGSKVK